MAVGRPQFGEAGRYTRTEAKQRTAVDGVGSKTCFSLLKRPTQKIQCHNIFTSLPCRHTALSKGELKPLSLSSKPLDPVDKNIIILPHRIQWLLVYLCLVTCRNMLGCVNVLKHKSHTIVLDKSRQR